MWWLKLAVTILGYIFASINQFFDPNDIAKLPENTSPEDIASIRIGVFAFITAIALFAGLIHTGKEPRDKWVHFGTLGLGVVAAFGTGWHTLEIATGEKPVTYLVGMGTLAGLLIVTLLIAVGIGTATNQTGKLFGDGVDAALFLLRTVFCKARKFIRWPTNGNESE